MRTSERLKILKRSPLLATNLLLRGRYDFAYDFMPVSLQSISWKKRLNLLRAGTNFFYRPLRIRNWPLHMQFELTSYCNLRCPVCPVGTRTLNRAPQAMDINLFEKIYSTVGPYLLTSSLWGWGESLLHPHLDEILRITGKYPVATILSTNGQNLDQERIIETLIEHPPVYLILAIDGITDETNSRFRIGARLEPILKGVQRLAELKRERKQLFPILHMRFIVMDFNEHEVPLLKEFARNHFFDMLTIRSLNIIDTSDIDSIYRRYEPSHPEFHAYKAKGDKRDRRSDFVCLQPYNLPTVFADGTLVTCDQDYNAQLPFGIINNHTSFPDLWFGKGSQAIRKRIRDDSQSLSFCQHCPFAEKETCDCSIGAVPLSDDSIPSAKIVTTVHSSSRV